MVHVGVGASVAVDIHVKRRRVRQIFRPVGQAVAVGILVIAPRIDREVLLEPEEESVRAVRFKRVAHVCRFLARIDIVDIDRTLIIRCGVDLVAVDDMGAWVACISPRILLRPEPADVRRPVLVQVVRRIAIDADARIEAIWRRMARRVAYIRMVRKDGDAVAALDHVLGDIQRSRNDRRAADFIVGIATDLRLAVDLTGQMVVYVFAGTSLRVRTEADALAVDEDVDFIDAVIAVLVAWDIAKQP